MTNVMERLFVMFFIFNSFWDLKSLSTIMAVGVCGKSVLNICTVQKFMAGPKMYLRIQVVIKDCDFSF